MESAWVLHFLEFTHLKCLSNAENSHHITLKTIIIIEIWWPLKSENLNFNLIKWIGALTSKQSTYIQTVP